MQSDNMINLKMNDTTISVPLSTATSIPYISTIIDDFGIIDNTIILTNMIRPDDLIQVINYVNNIDYHITPGFFALCDFLMIKLKSCFNKNCNRPIYNIINKYSKDSENYEGFSIFCDIHQCEECCKSYLSNKTFCSYLMIIDESYVIHMCRILDCVNNACLSGCNKYCDHHNCKRPYCDNQYAESSYYCNVHTCKITTCSNPAKHNAMYNTQYCETHACSRTYCQNKIIARGYDRCFNHMHFCKANTCREEVCYDRDYCYRHQCKDYSCCNLIISPYSYCKKHICHHEWCKNKSLKNTLYCENHQTSNSIKYMLIGY